ncbi:hypothetical protein MASR2M15_15060 [Anaerolineales bacterium]
MRTSTWLIIGTALITLILVLFVGSQLVQPPLPLLSYAAFNLDSISPNADGDADITRFSYQLNRNANVSLYIEASDGTSYIFRNAEPRTEGDYSVLFSGVVDGFLLPDEEVAGTIERRLIPNGEYTWRLIAENETETQEITGSLSVHDGDNPLPEISVFSVSPDTFTPNQDGRQDRVEINIYLTKDSQLDVYLLGKNDVVIPISARKEGRLPGEAGRHVFDYEGGIDLGADPPPDGTYTVIATAQDAVGQRTRQEAQLTIQLGGKPRAEIVPQNVGVDVIFTTIPWDEAYFSDENHLGQLIEKPIDPEDRANRPITMPVGDVLVFQLTIENYTNVPIRTTGPTPGLVYDQKQLSASLGAYEESGAWRVGIQCETSMTSYPWRWAIGSSDDLIEDLDEKTGDTFYYLPPRSRAIVWGGIRMTDLQTRNNPQDCWAGLIHEDVEVSLHNNNVGRRSVELVDPLAETDN